MVLNVMDHEIFHPVLSRLITIVKGIDRHFRIRCNCRKLYFLNRSWTILHNAYIIIFWYQKWLHQTSIAFIALMQNMKKILYSTFPTFNFSISQFLISIEMHNIVHFYSSSSTISKSDLEAEDDIHWKKKPSNSYQMYFI